MDPECRRLARNRRVIEGAPASNGFFAAERRDSRQLVRFGARIRGFGIQNVAQPPLERRQCGLMVRKTGEIRCFSRIVFEIEELRRLVHVVNVLPRSVTEHVRGIAGTDRVVFAENGPILVGIPGDLP